MVALTGGGTGGHLRIVELIKGELNRRGIEPVFIGSTAGRDREWIKGEGWKSCHFLESSGVANRRGVAKLGVLAKIGKESFKAVEIFRREGVERVVSVGGYSSAPATIGAIITGRPLYLHEQNSIPGLVTRMARPFARRLFNSFFGSDGYPVDPNFYRTARRRERMEKVIFLGGSQGARGINRLAVELAPQLLEREVEVIHQTGARNWEEVRGEYRKRGLEGKVHLFPFSDRLYQLVGEADLAISRAGASTLFELVSNGLPAVFIPYPYAAGDHQFFNALYLKQRGLGEVVREPEATPAKVLELMDRLVRHLPQISEELLKLNPPDSLSKIVDAILE